MKTLKDYNPRYLAKLEEYRKAGEKAPGAMAFLDMCHFASRNRSLIERERADWTDEDEKEHCRLLEESFSDDDLRQLSIVGIHPIQRMHYGKLLEERGRKKTPPAPQP